ncbi:unnamed protein product [Calicophoron daubneyi]|uniref:Vacuolar protein sorting-associated protein 18 homolog n=1 Tax=Calicophoron daubneyi TaxID=300641 RepID=A0AAV2TEN7_CALDB
MATVNKAGGQSSAEFFSRDGIFSLEALRSFRPTSALTNLQVANNHIVAATGKNTLIRFSGSPPSKFSEIEITRLSDDRVNNLFLDPMGWHTIISMQSGANFYTNRGMKKVRPLNKAKDLLIDSVAWNQHNTDETSTQEILIGTNDGHVIETMLVNDEGRFITSSMEQYWKVIINLGHCITGLEIIRFPPGSTSVLVGEPQRCVILVTTPSRMYQFAGWIDTSGGMNMINYISTGSPAPNTANTTPDIRISSFDPYVQSSGGGGGGGGGGCGGGLFPTNTTGLFHKVFSSDDPRLPAGSKVTEFPQGFGYSDLKLYRSPNAELPSQFAWMTGPGIYFGYLKTEQLSLPLFGRIPGQEAAAKSSPAPTEVSGDDLPQGNPTSSDSFVDVNAPADVFAGRSVNLTRHTKLLPYPVIRMLERPGLPLGISLTAFHVIVVYADRVKAVNLLDERTVYSMSLTAELGNGQALGICRDSASQNIWIFGSNGIARLNVNNELCRIWQIYLDELKFDKAREYCQNESQMDTVNMREAEYCFDQGDFMKSAKLFARTSVPFEEVALRFSQLSLAQDGQLSNSPPILRGLAVTDDNDVLNALVHAPDDQTSATSLSNSKIIVQSVRSKIEHLAGFSAPLKALVSSKLEQLITKYERAKVSKGKIGPDGADGTGDLSGQIGLLFLWMVELLLTEISFLRDQSEKQEPSADSTSGRRLATVRSEFKQLLTQPAVWPVLSDSKELLYELIENHGNEKELIFLANLVKDYTRLVDYYIRTGLYTEALKLLGSELVCLPQVYTHAAVLVTHCPTETVDAWLRLGKRLDPVRLLPDIMLLPAKEAMRYLQAAIEVHKCTDQSVHHLFITLLAEASSTVQSSTGGGGGGGELEEDGLMHYLEATSGRAINLASLNEHQPDSTDQDSTPVATLAADRSFWTSGLGSITPQATLAPASDMNAFSIPKLDSSFIQSVLPYDPGFVLRTCKEVGHLQGTVFILKLLGMHQQALQTAIDWGNVTLAKEIAQNESLSRDARRQLWLIIARHVIEKESNMKEATNLLKECPLLKLEDILPYFHDFVTIDQFKDAICDSLDSYHDRIEEVKREMNVTMTSTKVLKKHLDALRYRSEEIDADDRCAHCHYALLTRAFYVFSCGHNFHANCLTELVRPHLTPEQKNELSKLIEPQERGDVANSVDCQTKFDELIAADCAHCGQIAITNVSKLFFENQASYETELAIWQ